MISQILLISDSFVIFFNKKVLGRQCTFGNVSTIDMVIDVLPYDIKEKNILDSMCLYTMSTMHVNEFLHRFTGFHNDINEGIAIDTLITSRNIFKMEKSKQNANVSDFFNNSNSTYLLDNILQTPL
ncbi:hypothetical protein [Aquimarina pacifica]|uniref:hypothetical protein n=1 Tax=Aquimarina pacifica TaxID=1296415 RepID=UPI00046FD652|nr:hypothetical protein [Aquimarina pacifica]